MTPSPRDAAGMHAGGAGNTDKDYAWNFFFSL